MDYAQEQADELEALSSIFADDLEGAPRLQPRRRRRRSSLAHSCCRCRAQLRLTPPSPLPPPHPAEVRDSIPSGWSPVGAVWRVVVSPQAEDGQEMEIPSERQRCLLERCWCWGWRVHRCPGAGQRTDSIVACMSPP